MKIYLFVYEWHPTANPDVLVSGSSFIREETLERAREQLLSVLEYPERIQIQEQREATLQDVIDLLPFDNSVFTLREDIPGFVIDNPFFT